ncbi:SCO2522 family protein [Catenuloplanes atrovinosus]|uniref:Uncharacterized protein n=1 Tax=Catenuloplanes atrovinosus TaxID=137266 RepID=A0AAE3YK92_9ACTN|nr:SCO2522 family protein [Catenuloplanes atrovinosus]MDR7273841.1 hypothetical protein [Catenuloplanes atrovinosus]
MTVPEVTYSESTATPKVRSTPLSHLSIELGHLYMEDFAAGPERLRAQFRRVRPWAEALRRMEADSRPGQATRISTCFLIDDYFAPFGSPAEVLPALVSAAEESGLRIDYIARESACAAADGVEVARIVEGRLVADPPRGTNGSRPPTHQSGWLSNGEPPSTGVAVSEAMDAHPGWQPPRQNAVKNHSIYVDVEIWQEHKTGRLWACPFLAAVWQLLRMGLLRDHGEPVWRPEPVTPAELPGTWHEMPAVVQWEPRAAPFAAFRTASVLDTRFIEIEQAVRVILSQVAIQPEVGAQVARRAAAEGVTLPDEVVDRIDYVFTSRA